MKYPHDYGIEPMPEEHKTMTHHADYGMEGENRNVTPRPDAELVNSSTSNKPNETGLVFRQPL